MVDTKQIIATLLPAVPLMPLAGAITLGLLGKKIQNKFGETFVGLLGCLTPGLAAVISFFCFFQILGVAPEERSVTVDMGRWLSIGGLRVNWALTYDVLSSMMLMIITGIGFLIHVYAMGYMKGDKSFWRFFSYVNLFTASMLMLVLGDNLLVMFLGWEGVGLCSYLLIGFWFTEEANAIAGKKAFITNRIGDLGFLTGIFLLMYFSMGHFRHEGTTFAFGELHERIAWLSTQQVWGWPLLEVVGFCFFIGAMGKSAQIPLYVWLPDAMAGPTPVSALIHAATMVTAGVYMMARMNFLYTLAPHTLSIVSCVAAVTCIFSASIGLAQFDIKKVLAYSTVSQLGYMFLGMGVGAYSAGLFHLLSHAAFKAALFMGSGAVIVALHHKQDMRQMGGLLKKMPMTGAAFIMATLAIMGFPGTSGFFSKDEILWKAYSQGGVGLWLLGFLAAGMTSFYMWRLVFMTFFGKTRADHHTWDHCHEQPKRTWVPIFILAVASLFIGFLNVPHVLGGHSQFTVYMSPIVKDIEVAPAESVAHQPTKESSSPELVENDEENHEESAVAKSESHEKADPMEMILMVASIIWTLLMALLAYVMYLGAPELRESIMTAKPAQWIFKILNNKYYVDEIYQVIILDRVRDISRLMSAVDTWVVDGIVNGIAHLSKFIALITSAFDTGVIDGQVNGIASAAQYGGRLMSRIQSGRVQVVLTVSLSLFAALVLFVSFLFIL